MSDAKHNCANNHLIPKYNNHLNRFTVHSLISLMQRKLLTFGYLYSLEFESILISQNLHIFINARSTKSPAYTELATDSRPLRDLKSLRSRRGSKGREKVFLKSPTGRRLKSIAGSLSNLLKRLTATDFSREEVSKVTNWSATGRRSVTRRL